MTSAALSSPAASRAERAWRLLLAGAIGLLLCGVAQARQSDRSQPVKVNADAFDGSAKPDGIIHLKGSVVITQGSLKATSDTAIAYLDGQSQVKRTVLSGHAHIQQEDDQGKLMTGKAQHIDYTMGSGIAVLTGDASIRKAGTGSVSGEKLVYNTRTGQMSAHGSGKKRVHMVFLPQQRAGAASSAPRPAGQGN